MTTHYAIVDNIIHEWEGEGFPGSEWYRKIGLMRLWRWTGENFADHLIHFTRRGGYIRHGGRYRGVETFKSVDTDLKSFIRTHYPRVTRGHRHGVKAGRWQVIPETACGGFWIDTDGALRLKAPYPEGYEGE